jgi:hypothetical protein
MRLWWTFTGISTCFSWISEMKVIKCQDLSDDIVTRIAIRYLWRRLGVSLAAHAILMTARHRKYLVLVAEEGKGCHPGLLLVLVWPLR